MKIGIITYHAAYNFGSVLQAYATQSVLRGLGHDSIIINYRMPSQKQYYGLFHKITGVRSLIQNIESIKNYPGRKKRRNKYEQCISDLLVLTEEFSEPKELNSISDQFDIYVSGSDQIWNRHSNELCNVNWKYYMAPYLLEFTEKPKISYASSVVNMSDVELAEIKNSLLEFSCISCRERTASVRLSNLLNREIRTVVDPTLLLTKEEWEKIIQGWNNNYVFGDYVLYYSLKGSVQVNKDLDKLNKLLLMQNKQLVVIAPLANVKKRKNMIDASDAAIYDFIELIDNADLVVTDSYHGMLFSIIFNKQVFSYQYGIENERVNHVVDMLKIENIIISDLSEVRFDSVIDYSKVNSNLTELREKSLSYLRRSIDSIVDKN